MEQQKVCKGNCGKLKPLSEFYDFPDARDGKHNKCKECTKENQKGYRSKHKTLASKPTEQNVINILRDQGIYAAPGKCSEWDRCDVVAWGCVRIEVKMSNQNESGQFLFSATHKQRKGGFIADLVVMVCQWKDHTTYHVFPSNHSIFYNAGKMKQGFFYDPYIVARKSGHGGRITNALMNEHKDRWDLIEAKRLETIARLTGKEIIISNPTVQPTLFELTA